MLIIYTRGNEFEELTDSEKLDIYSSLDICDGVLFPGWLKFTPYDRYLLEVCIEKKIPVLGICLGMQMMSCYNQDVSLGDVEGDVIHDQKDDDLSLVHKVKVDKNSKLYNIIGKNEILVNSFHNHCACENSVYVITAKTYE